MKWILAMCALSCTTAFAQDMSSGFICSAWGTGIWGGTPQAFRWQSGLIPLGTGAAEITLYANEQPAAIFRVTHAGGNRWSGFSTTNPQVRLDAYVTPDGAATFVLNDWRNRNNAAAGSCEPARGPW